MQLPALMRYKARVNKNFGEFADGKCQLLAAKKNFSADILDLRAKTINFV
jgi:hypothetical protein